ncbi:MAG: DUF2231 domain-containing protein [Dehalococcoidia bacterium]
MTQHRRETNLELESIAGLPAHPLLVHGSVVLVPLAVIGFIAVGWRGAWRERYLLPVMLVAVAGWALAFLATQSGEPMEEHVRRVAAVAGEARPRFGEHPDLGNTAAILSFVFALAVGGMYAIERRLPSVKTSKSMVTAAYAVTAFIGLVALVWMVRAGHTGAELAWGD